MSESHLDEYEHYNYDQEKHVSGGHGGKHRSKKEIAEHQNQPDPSGHTRKIVNKLYNSELNKKKENKERRNSKE